MNPFPGGWVPQGLGPQVPWNKPSPAFYPDVARPRVYLAGPITGLTYDSADDWRGRASALLRPDVQPVSPLRGKEYLRSVGVIRDAERQVETSTARLEGAMSSARGITGRDRNDVRTSQAVLMNLQGAKRISIGTMIEAGWADAFRVPLVVVHDALGRHRHGMLDTIATYSVDDLEDAIQLVKVLVLP